MLPVMKTEPDFRPAVALMAQTRSSDGQASLPQVLLQRWCLWRLPVFPKDLFCYLIQAEQERAWSTCIEHWREHMQSYILCLWKSVQPIASLSSGNSHRSHQLKILSGSKPEGAVSLHSLISLGWDNWMFHFSIGWRRWAAGSGVSMQLISSRYHGPRCSNGWNLPKCAA